MSIPSLEDIRAAHERIRPHIHRTPIFTCKSINELVGADLYFKCENFQKVGAFKARGAANAVLQLSQDELDNGVTTHSSGNHAQALALAAKNAGAKAFIVMPSNAPQVKVDAVKGYGAEIIFCEPTLEARETTTAEVIKRTSATFIHPYDNYHIISGQATAALEMIEDMEEPLNILMAPVGGGGLLAGTALSTQYLSPNTKVIAAEPKGADDAWQSFQAKTLIPQKNPNTIADGLLTSLGDKNFGIILNSVDEIVICSEESILRAMRLIWERMKIIIEPSAAVPLAAILDNRFEHQGKKIGIILSGGNVDLGKLAF